MQRLRTILRASPLMGGAVMLAALLLRLAVPAGFMPIFDGGGVAVSLCGGSGDMMMAAPSGHHDPGPAPLAKSRCAFADLALPSLAGADPIRLAAALLFVLALGLDRPPAAISVQAVRVSPPLRGPPAA